MPISFRLPKVATAIAMRYSAILIQFGLVVLISRTTSIDVAGTYFVIYGWLNATYFMAGFGLPDGLVREVSLAISLDQAERVRPMVRRASVAFVVLAGVSAVVCAAIATVFGLQPSVAILAALWWLCYATSFYAAQCLVALGAVEAASFFFYPAPTIALLLSLVPYLLFANDPPISGILAAAVAGASPVAFLSAYSARRALTRGPWPFTQVPPGAVLRPMLTLGFKIAFARVAQTAIYWIPTWIAGIVLSPGAASIMGLSSRLNSAVSAVMSAIRFVVRPQIVAAAAQNDWRTIERNARLISTMTFLAVLACATIYLAIGRVMIRLVFGSNYEAVFPVLAILLLGTLVETIGGVVDEILKMTGSAQFLLLLLISVVAGEAVLGWWFHGLIELAAIQALALATLSLTEIAYTRITRGVLILPFANLRTARDAFRLRAPPVDKRAD